MDLISKLPRKEKRYPTMTTKFPSRKNLKLKAFLQYSHQSKPPFFDDFNRPSSGEMVGQNSSTFLKVSDHSSPIKAQLEQKMTYGIIYWISAISHGLLNLMSIRFWSKIQWVLQLLTEQALLEHWVQTSSRNVRHVTVTTPNYKLL